MAGIGSWYPKLYVYKPPCGIPSSTYQVAPQPLYDSTTGKFYCVWILSNNLIIRELLSPVTLYTHAIYSNVQSGYSAVFNGYIYFIGGKATRQCALYRVAIATWSVEELVILEVGTSGISYGGVYFDGSDYIYISSFYVSGGVNQVKIHKYSISGDTDTTIYSTSGDTGAIAFRGIVGTNLYITRYPSGNGYIPVAGGSFTADSWIVFGNGFHAKSLSTKTLYNPSESWSGALENNIEADCLIIFGDETTPKIIQYSATDPTSIIYYEGTTVVYRDSATLNDFLWRTGAHLSDRSTKFHQSPALVRYKGFFRSIGAEVT